MRIKMHAALLRTRRHLPCVEFLIIFVFFKHYNGRGTQAGEFAQRADHKLGAYVGPVSSYGAVVGYV